MSTHVFPLRLRDERVQRLARELADRENISLNELIGQAVANEVVARGARLVDDLTDAAAQLGAMTDEQLARRVDASIIEFGQGEAHADPLVSRAIVDPAGWPESGSTLPLSGVEAFQQAVAETATGASTDALTFPISPALAELGVTRPVSRS